MGGFMDFISLLAQSSSSEDSAAAAAVFGGIGLIFILIWLLLIGLGIAGFVLWLISLIHVLQHNDVKDRVMWILILLLVGTIGGVIYFFTVKRTYDSGGAREPLPPIGQ